MKSHKIKNQDAFSTMHPFINFTYFTVVIVCSMFFLHPVFLSISLFTSLIYSIVLNGKKTLKFVGIYVLPIMIMSIILNPLFNHEGVTILTYFKDGNPLTLESILYGIATAIMFTSVILWFSSYNIVMTSDKFIYIFGRLIPSLSLFFSMVLRFVPRYKEQIKKIDKSRKAMGKTPKGKSLFSKINYALTILSILITWALENAIETSDSMRARGYGLKNRTSFSIFKMDKRDLKTLITMIICIFFIIIGIVFEKNTIRYYPSIKFSNIDCFSIIVYFAYTVFCLLPIIIDIMEEKAWKSSQSKI